MTRHYSAALPIAYVLLRILIILNWLLAAAIIILLVAVPHEAWIMKELSLTPSPEASRIVWSLRGVALVGLLSTPLNHLVLTRLLAMVGSVRNGDPFVRANALRLRVIAWTLLGLQLLGLCVAALGDMIESAGHDLNFDGPSLSSWLAVLLTFVLAHVFAEGALMREDLEGTV